MVSLFLVVGFVWFCGLWVGLVVCLGFSCWSVLLFLGVVFVLSFLVAVSFCCVWLGGGCLLVLAVYWFSLFVFRNYALWDIWVSFGCVLGDLRCWFLFICVWLFFLIVGFFLYFEFCYVSWCGVFLGWLLFGNYFGVGLCFVFVWIWVVLGELVIVVGRCCGFGFRLFFVGLVWM